MCDRVAGVGRTYIAVVAMEVGCTTVRDIRVDTCVVRQACIERTGFPITAVVIRIAIEWILWIGALTIQAFVERSRIIVIALIRPITAFLVRIRRNFAGESVPVTYVGRTWVEVVTRQIEVS